MKNAFARLRPAALRPARFDRTLIRAGSLGLALLSSMAGAQAVYRCETKGVVIYADRPCSADAAVHESDGRRVTVYDAPPIYQHASSQRASEPRPRASNAQSVNKAVNKAANKGAAAVLAKRQASCAKLDRSLREVRSKLRSGYGVKEGERLKARQRQLAERRRTEKCR